METIDVVPNKQKSIPVLFAPGWREMPFLTKDCIDGIVSHNRRVISLAHPLYSYKNRIASPYPDVELQKAQYLIALCQSKNIVQVDAVTHSEGSINVAIAAVLKPDLFRSIIFLTPAGLMGKDNIFRLSLAFLFHMSQRKQNKLFLNLLKQNHSLHSHLESIRTAFYEGKAMTTFDILPLLKEIQENGTKIAIVAGKTDPVFPLHRIKQHLEGKFEPDIFELKEYGHHIYQNVDDTIRIIVNILERFEKYNG